MKIKNIFILGKNGIGKTRLVKEMCMFITRRKIFLNGVYYLDFTDVINVKDIKNIFYKSGLVKLMNSSKPKEDNKNNYNYLLIYDNIEHIYEKTKLFYKHLN